MELKNALAGSSKGQLMTLLMLIIFILLLAELFAFALINVSSNEVTQSLTVATSSSNYGNLLRLSANNFAAESLSKAIATLATYESTPSYRKSNFISNTSFYVSNLMISGILPNDTSGYPQNAMGNLTFGSYNTSIANLLGFASQVVVVNESRPFIFQPDSYHIGVSYIERVTINASGNNYAYNIQVNASLPLNGTPDLFYSQQGILRPVSFASLSNVTVPIGGTASSGNTIAYGYGTVYWLASNAVSGAACSSIPSRFSSASVSKNIVLATYNAVGLESCENNYAGLITYIAPTTLPTVAYLLYPSSSNLLQIIPAGTRVLVYGPSLQTLNIEGLRNDISDGRYFASPFTPSYLDRAQGNFNSQSNTGVFTFSNYNKQAATFDGQSSIISGNVPSSVNGNPITVTAWVDPFNNNTGNWLGIVYVGSDCSTAETLAIQGGNLQLDTCGSNGGNFNSGIGVPSNKWTFVAYTLNGTSLALYVNSNVKTITSTGTPSTSGTLLYIGNDKEATRPPINGEISNVQVYNSALTPTQIQSIYQQGVSGLPPSNSALAGWWPLNGNANDYSGNANNAAVTSVTYNLLQNYSRDSILQTPVPTKLSPVPGVLSCTSNSNCASNTIPQLYLGYMPLEMQNGYFQTGKFNGASSQIVESSPAITLGPNYGISFWTYPTSFSTQPESIQQSGGVIQDGPPYSSTGQINVGMYIGGTYYSYETPTSIEVPLNAWSNIAFTLNTLATGGNVLTECANGVCNSITVAAGTIDTTSNPVHIGSYSGSCCWVNGQLANFQVYSNPLTQNQITQLYQEGIAGLPIQNKLLAWWLLNGNANDYSGYNYNGVGTNVNYPFFSGTYNAPGLSTISTSANEWQALDMPSPS